MSEPGYLLDEPIPSDRGAPRPGFVWRWIPEEQASSADAPAFVALSEDEERKGCRYQLRDPRRNCKEPSVAKTRRKRGVWDTTWWHYCPEHLYRYRRVIRDGQVWACVAVEKTS